MTYDYYQSLHNQTSCSNPVNATVLASGFVDRCAVWSCKDKPQDKKAPDLKNEARRCYMEKAALLNNLRTEQIDCISEPAFSCLPDSAWLGITTSFTLQTPWYSKDERPFHVMDNPVRKDRVFGVPFMSAASWKGMLRWACRIQKEMNKPEEVHIFGNEKDEQEDFRSGAMVFYPTWFNKVGFEVINPHSRKTKSGTKPIYYEIVPPSKDKYILNVLYAPFPGQVERDQVNPQEVLLKLIDAIAVLLEKYGISAKRTVGWGTAKIDSWSGFIKAEEKIVKNEVVLKKKNLKSFQELGETDTELKTLFSKNNAKEFKGTMQERFAFKGGA
ncbi:MAG: hypothetical protein KKH34_04420 [Candidatus Omnitrophica bacterium]|nr:hypothetical protein [Candidatus Omnitrophota bacterium]